MPGFVLTHETNTAFFVIALVLHKSQCSDLITSTGLKVDLSKVHVTTSHRETVSCRNMKMFDTGMKSRALNALWWEGVVAIVPFKSRQN